MSKENSQQNNVSVSISVSVEGDKSGFVSKTAIDRFKSTVRSNLNFDMGELSAKFVKPDYHLELVSKTSNEVKFMLDKVAESSKEIVEITEESSQLSTQTPNSIEPSNLLDDKKKRKEFLRAKINMMKKDRTNSGYRTAKSNENVSDEILNEYVKLKKISKMPIPEPTEILSNPEQYKPIISMVLGNNMMKQLGSTHPYVKYFKLIAEKLGIDSNSQLPMPTQDFSNKAELPSGLSNVMNMAGPTSELKGNELNEGDESTDSEDENQD
jgi:hypothetical protein